MNLRLHAAVLASVTSALFLNGCGTYSATRDKQSQEVKKSVDSIDFGPEYADLRKKWAAMLDAEIEYDQSIAVDRREVLFRGLSYDEKVPVADALSRFAGRYSPSFLVNVQQTFTETPARAQARSNLLKHLAARKTSEAWVTFYQSGNLNLRRALEIAKAPVPSCDGLKKNDESAQALNDLIAKNSGTPKGEVLAQISKSLTAHCQGIELNTPAEGTLFTATDDDFQTAGAKATHDALVALQSDIRKEDTAVKALRDQIKTRRAEIAALAKTIADAEGPSKEAKTAADKDKDKKDLEGRRKAAEDAQKLLNAIKSSGDLVDLLALSQEQLTSLDTFLETVKSTEEGKAPPEDATRAAKAAVLLPDIWTDARKQFKENKKISLAPVKLKHDVTQQIAAKLEAEVSRREKLVILRKTDYLLKLSNLEHELLVQEAIGCFPPSFRASTFRSVFDKEPSDSNVVAYNCFVTQPDRAAGGLVTVQSNGGTQAKYKERAIREVHRMLLLDRKQSTTALELQKAITLNLKEERIAASEYSTRVWMTYLKLSADQLVTFGKSGLTADDAQKFIQVILLAIIAGK